MRPDPVQHPLRIGGDKLVLRRAGQLMAVSTAAAAIFFLLIPVVVPDGGVLAASYLNLLVGAVWSGGCALVFARAVRSMRRAGPPQD